ncbi:hypothetical protein [Haloferax sp. DFSO52]
MVSRTREASRLVGLVVAIVVAELLFLVVPSSPVSTIPVLVRIQSERDE